MCPSVPQRPERSAVRCRPIAAQNCIFIAIIDYLKLWSEEEIILSNKAQLGSTKKQLNIKRTNFIVGTVRRTSSYFCLLGEFLCKLDLVMLRK